MNIRTETKPFRHTFVERGPLDRVSGWHCCVCGYFTPKMTDKEKKLVCGHVTAPVMP